MAIADTINSMYENVGEVYDTITNVDLPTNKNIENIPSTIRKSYLDIMNNGIDTIYDNWEKVNGTGTSISLNNTEEAPMTIEYKGNTSQETTTGKNLFYIPPQTLNGVTLSYASDGAIVLNGTSNQTFTAFKTSISLSGQYTLSASCLSSQENTFVRTRNANNTLVQTITLNKTERQHWTANSELSYLEITIGANGVTYNNFKIYAQLESGASETSFEPYTNGATPRPTYPQDIHIVSGDNTINVCGKNLIISPYSDTTKTTGNLVWTLNNDGTILVNGTNNTGYTKYFNVVGFDAPSPIHLAPGTYTASLGVSSNVRCTIANYYNNTDVIATISANSNKKTFTITETKDVSFVLAVNNTLSVDNALISPQIEVGSTATEYEAYKGASYEINLGVDNLVNPSLYNMGGSYNVVSFNEGEVISTSITGYAGVRIALGQNIDLKNSDEIYVRLKIKSDVAGDVFNTIQLMNTSNAVITTTDTKVLAPTMTTEYQEYIMKFVLGNDDTLNKLFIQHKGSSNNTFIIKDIQVSYTNGSYTPYGKAIELCKIGTYQDRIFKSSGKNLFDKDNLEHGTISQTDGKTITTNNSISHTSYISVKPNTSYYMSSSVSGLAVRYFTYDNNQNFITTGLMTFPITIPSNVYYIRLQLSDSFLVNVMLNEGSTALPYEPYGKVWYLNKQIGKVVLDGSENWTVHGGIASWFYYDGIIDGYVLDNTQILIKTNYYTPKAYQGVPNLVNGECAYGTSDSGITHRFVIKNTDYTQTNDFKNWLSTHNTIVYYVLVTPTYTEITDSTLLSQLNALAKSYTGQTNISQENNDLASILNATALREMS